MSPPLNRTSPLPFSAPPPHNASMPQPRTKIVMTIGPASAKPEVFPKLLDAGVSVVRLNFSHGTPEQRKT